VGPARSSGILTHSVLDRVAGTGEGPTRSTRLAIGVDDLRRAVRRDLEWLLNTRRVLGDEYEGLEEVSTSHLAFGLPDLSLFSRTSKLDSRAVCGLIEAAIAAFEPRMEKGSVKVDFVESSSVDDFSMHFRIRGVLHVEPITEPVVFDTALDPHNGTLRVEDVE
jgi:type VI secretion system protein ImpF